MDALRISEFQYWVMTDLTKRPMISGDEGFPYPTLRALMRRGLVRWHDDGRVRLTPSGHLVLSTIRIIDECRHKHGTGVVLPNL